MNEVKTTRVRVLQNVSPWHSADVLSYACWCWLWALVKYDVRRLIAANHRGLQIFIDLHAASRNCCYINLCLWLHFIEQQLILWLCNNSEFGRDNKFVAYT